MSKFIYFPLDILKIMDQFCPGLLAVLRATHPALRRIIPRAKKNSQLFYWHWLIGENIICHNVESFKVLLQLETDPIFLNDLAPPEHLTERFAREAIKNGPLSAVKWVLPHLTLAPGFTLVQQMARYLNELLDGPDEVVEWVLRGEDLKGLEHVVRGDNDIKRIAEMHGVSYFASHSPPVQTVSAAGVRYLCTGGFDLWTRIREDMVSGRTIQYPSDPYHEIYIAVAFADYDFLRNNKFDPAILMQAAMDLGDAPAIRLALTLGAELDTKLSTKGLAFHCDEESIEIVSARLPLDMELLVRFNCVDKLAWHFERRKSKSFLKDCAISAIKLGRPIVFKWAVFDQCSGVALDELIIKFISMGRIEMAIESVKRHLSD